MSCAWAKKASGEEACGLGLYSPLSFRQASVFGDSDAIRWGDADSDSEIQRRGGTRLERREEIDQPQVHFQTETVSANSSADVTCLATRHICGDELGGCALFSPQAASHLSFFAFALHRNVAGKGSLLLNDVVTYDVQSAISVLRWRV
eukprot:1371784-Rhodomonas_salina.1